VVADQFRLGIYGVAAAEAMALGRLVVSDVDQSVRDAVQRRAGRPLPIWQLAAEDLADGLEAILADRAPFQALAAEGPAFAAAVHSGARSRQALAAALGCG
jgi:glycosyltransferase involved in cell wall biosynthesis